MSNYKKGKIYKITCDETNEIYYGSTCDTLSCRMRGHRAGYKEWKAGKEGRRYISSYQLIQYDSAKITLVERYSCNTKFRLLAREQFYIKNNKCINIIKKFNQTREDKLNYWHQYRIINREKILADKKEYYYTHLEPAKANRIARAEDINRYAKHFRETRGDYYIQYRADHVEDKKAYNVIWRAKNEHKLKEKILCECGTLSCRSNINEHRKTAKHIKLMGTK